MAIVRVSGSTLFIDEAYANQIGDVVQILPDPYIPPTPQPQGNLILQLYRNSSEPNRVDKTDYLTLVTTISGTLREETSLTDMSITIEYSGVPNFNYVYIPIFNRYYYVVDVTSIRYNLWEITLSVDVLMTYKEGILNTPAFIERSQSLINNNLPDKKRIVEIGYDIEVIDVDSDVFVEKIDIMDFNFIINGYKLQASKIE